MSQPSPDLHALLAQIRAVARGTKGVTGEEQALAAQIWAFKAEAVPFVLPLLMSPKAGVSKLAGYILRELDGVTEADLDALIAACRGGNEWVAPAIGRIGTPTAVQFLVDALLSKPERHTQTTFALGRVGEPAALAFAAVLAGPVAQPRAVARAMGEVVNAMGARGASAIDAFLDVARTPGPNQAHAVYLVGAYGEVARGAVESLRALAERHEELRRAVDQAIASIGGKDAAEVLAVELSTNPSWLGLVRLARLREKGQAAGPAVVALLASEDWEIRVCAARTLGLLGWTDGEEALRNVLAHRDDWRLVWAAADSLGRLRAQGSADLLEQVASTHWYPPVREVAARAARGESDEDASSHEFLAWERVVVPDRPMPPPWLVPDPLQLSVAELAELTIDGSLFRATTEPASSHLLTPTCGLRLGRGALLGVGHGEFGGGVAYLEGGVVSVLLVQTTHALHTHAGGALAVTGLAHLGRSHGDLWRIEAGGTDEDPRVVRRTVLPGAPIRSGALSNGNIYISCTGGDVIVLADGEIQMA
jgi:HEAT repeat protein